MAAPGTFPESLEERFEVLDLLGQGGFGRVVLARDRELNRQVAIKVHAMAAHVPDAIERFHQEAQVTARVEAPEVVRIYDHGVEAGGEAWIVYEYIQGETLAARLARKVRLPVEVCCDWGRRVASALQQVHDQGVVHRDIKPANVLIRTDGGEETPVLCDFGLAWTGQGRKVRTQEGLVLGTPSYMPPELFFGGAPSPGGDQYAWAAVLYEMVYGRKLQPDPNPSTVVQNLKSGRGPDFRGGDDLLVPPFLVDALARALDQDPDRRFPSMDALARGLEGRQQRTTATRRPDLGGAATVAVDSRVLRRGDRPRDPPRRSRVAPLVGAGILLLGCLAVGVFWPGGAAPPTQPTPPIPPTIQGPTGDPVARAAAERALEDLLRYLDEPSLAAGPEAGFKRDDHLRLRADQLADEWQYGKKFTRYTEALVAWAPAATRTPEGRAALGLHARWLDHLTADFEGAFERAEVPHKILDWGPQERILPLLSKLVRAWTAQKERLRALNAALREVEVTPCREVIDVQWWPAIRGAFPEMESILDDLLRLVEATPAQAEARALMNRLGRYTVAREAGHYVSCRFRREVLQRVARRNARAGLAPDGRRAALSLIGELVWVTFQMCPKELGELELAAVDELLEQVEAELSPEDDDSLKLFESRYRDALRPPSNTLAIRLERVAAMRARLAGP